MATSTIRRLILRRFGALCAAILLTACGAEPDAEISAVKPDAKSGDVCAWLSLEEVEALTGVVPVSTQSTGGVKGCHWTDGDGLPLVQLTIVANGASSPEDYSAGLAADLGDDWVREQLKPVDNLGDWAFWTPEGRMLQVFRGRATLQIMVSRPAGEPEAKALAGKLLDRDW